MRAKAKNKIDPKIIRKRWNAQVKAALKKGKRYPDARSALRGL